MWIAGKREIRIPPNNGICFVDVSMHVRRRSVIKLSSSGFADEISSALIFPVRTIVSIVQAIVVPIFDVVLIEQTSCFFRNGYVFWFGLPIPSSEMFALKTVWLHVFLFINKEGMRTGIGEWEGHLYRAPWDVHTQGVHKQVLTLYIAICCLTISVHAPEIG